jgi:hypothetical protein
MERESPILSEPPIFKRIAALKVHMHDIYDQVFHLKSQLALGSHPKFI